MSDEQDRRTSRQLKWLSWATLLAGAVMCAVAFLMS
jgi:hypothetical protein